MSRDRLRTNTNSASGRGGLKSTVVGYSAYEDDVYIDVLDVAINVSNRMRPADLRSSFFTAIGPSRDTRPPLALALFVIPGPELSAADFVSALMNVANLVQHEGLYIGMDTDGRALFESVSGHIRAK